MGQVRRRQILIAAGTLMASRSVFAQPAARRWRIGFLSLDTAASGAGQGVQTYFPAALEKLGYREGKNFDMVWRWADGVSADLAKLAEELVRLPVDIIVARTSGPIEAAKNATLLIPIVMLNGNYPVETGLVESLARPGGNVTGTSYLSIETHAKQIQLLKEIAPRVRHLAAPMGGFAKSKFRQLLRAQLEGAADRFGMSIQYFEIQRPEEITSALDKLVASKCDCLYYQGDPLFRARQAELVAITLAKKMASVSNIPGFAEAGGLVQYAPDFAEFINQTAGYVDRILKGARPADLPVHQPTKYELVVNLKTANSVGIKVPHSILARADRVIE